MMGGDGVSAPMGTRRESDQRRDAWMERPRLRSFLSFAASPPPTRPITFGSHLATLPLEKNRPDDNSFFPTHSPLMHRAARRSESIVRVTHAALSRV